jgi:DNA polymerase-3 subunit gamma/tau
VKDLGIDAEDKALAQIAGHSQGSVRDALSLLDKAIAFGKEKLSYEDVLTLLGAVSMKFFTIFLKLSYEGIQHCRP